MELPGFYPLAEQRVHPQRFSGCFICRAHRESPGGTLFAAFRCSGPLLPALFPTQSCPTMDFLPPGERCGHIPASSARSAGADTLPSRSPGQERSFCRCSGFPGLGKAGERVQPVLLEHPVPSGASHGAPGAPRALLFWRPVRPQIGPSIQGQARGNFAQRWESRGGQGGALI